MGTTMVFAPDASASGVFPVTVPGDTTLADRLQVLLKAAFTDMKNPAGAFRFQDADDINDSDYLEVTVPDTSGVASVITPGTQPNPVDFLERVQVNLTAGDTTGTLAHLGWGAAVVQGAADLNGIVLDMATHITQAGAHALNGLTVTLPNPYAGTAEYAIDASGGGYGFLACSHAQAAAGHFNDAAHAVHFADGTNAITVVTGNADVSAGQFLAQYTEQAGDPTPGTGAGQIAPKAIATWKDTSGNKWYIGTNVGGAVKKVQIA